MGVNEHVTFGTFEQTEIFCSVQIELFRKESSKKRCHGVEFLIKHAVGFFFALPFYIILRLYQEMQIWLKGTAKIL